MHGVAVLPFLAPFVMCRSALTCSVQLFVGEDHSFNKVQVDIRVAPRLICASLLCAGHGGRGGRAVRVVLRSLPLAVAANSLRAVGVHVGGVAEVAGGGWWARLFQECSLSRSVKCHASVKRQLKTEMGFSPIPDPIHSHVPPHLPSQLRY